MQNRRRIPQRDNSSYGDEVLEDEMTRRTNERMEVLQRSVAQIREGAEAIQQHMIDEEGLVVEIDKDMEKN